MSRVLTSSAALCGAPTPAADGITGAAGKWACPLENVKPRRHADGTDDPFGYAAWRCQRAALMRFPGRREGGVITEREQTGDPLATFLLQGSEQQV
ncbi:unnamed protein product [Lota lota]